MMRLLLLVAPLFCSLDVIKAQQWYCYATRDGYLFNRQPVSHVFTDATATLHPPSQSATVSTMVEGLLGAVRVRGRLLLVVVTKCEETGVTGVSEVKEVELLSSLPGTGYIEQSFENTVRWLMQIGWYVSTAAPPDAFLANKHLRKELTVIDPPADVIMNAFNGYVGCVEVAGVRVCVTARQDFSRAGIVDYVNGVDDDGNVSGKFAVTMTLEKDKVKVEETVWMMHPPILMTEKGGVAPMADKQKAAFQAFLKQYTRKPVQFYHAIKDENVKQALQAQLNVPGVTHAPFKPVNPKGMIARALGFLTGQVNPVMQWAALEPFDNENPIVILHNDSDSGVEILQAFLRRLASHHLTHKFKVPVAKEKLAELDAIAAKVGMAVMSSTVSKTMTVMGTVGWWAFPAADKQRAMDWVYGTVWSPQAIAEASKE